MNERNCKECAHYIVTDTRNNYCMNGCGTYTQEIYGCEVWECEFKEKESDGNSRKMSYL